MNVGKIVSRAGVASLLSLSVALFIAVGTVSAHAKVISATPGIGATVASAPSIIRVKTAENVDPDPTKTNLFVYSPEGELISKGNATVNRDNPQEMTVNIDAKGKGTYIVRWITASAEDKDPDEGAFTFTVGTATGTTSNVTTATPANSSISWLPLILVGIVTLLLGLAAGFGIGRSNARKIASTETTPTS